MSDTTTITERPAVPADLAECLDELTAALAAIGSGDPAPYRAMWADSPDVTLFGAWGPTEHGHEAVTRTFSWVAGRFSDGALRPHHDVVGVSGDLAYTVGVEEGEVRVDGGPPASMRLRVTHVLRRIDGRWRLVHRHADLPPSDPRP
ncbi:MAG TPA: nuclear transport factor 2 family protein [Pseudonocardia sp.]|nr:nuclear transport factor 2 family protein [Pseudonocardia sp.]